MKTSMRLCIYNLRSTKDAILDEDEFIKTVNIDDIQFVQLPNLYTSILKDKNLNKIFKYLLQYKEPEENKEVKPNEENKEVKPNEENNNNFGLNGEKSSENKNNNKSDKSRKKKYK